MATLVSVLLIGLLAAREILLYWDGGSSRALHYVSLAVIPLLIVFVSIIAVGVIGAL